MAAADLNTPRAILATSLDFRAPRSSDFAMPSNVSNSSRPGWPSALRVDAINRHDRISCRLEIDVALRPMATNAELLEQYRRVPSFLTPYDAEPISIDAVRSTIADLS